MWGALLARASAHVWQDAFWITFREGSQKTYPGHIQHTVSVSSREGRDGEREVVQEEVWQWENCLPAQNEFCWSHQLSLKFNSNAQPTRFSTS